MAKKYLVTGGTGFIGSAIVSRLVRKGETVVCLDNNSRGAARKLGELASDIELVEADIRDSDAVIRAARGVDSVLHLAFVNGTEFFYKQPETVLDVGVRGMINVLDACRTHHVPELVLASSSEVYQTPPSIPTDESVPLMIPDVLNPRYSYAGGKLISELMAINYGRTGFDRVMIFRPHNVYGPDMGWEHVLPQFVLRMLDSIAPQPSGSLRFGIQGDGTQTRAFVQIEDFVDGIMCMLSHGEHLNIYHIGNPEEISIREVAVQVARFFGREIEIVCGPEAPGGTPRRCPDISKLGRLGYQPQISFEKGLPSLAQWYVNNISLRPKI
ncbi:MAG: NAD-dependent dehydratase [Chloroflexi bacterium RBG_16_52_11]|nr:MAG: NAD-dependent dehydratase [Chloroflexi bacterium RBG_16_52_11]